jgi:hypothetical protein
MSSPALQINKEDLVEEYMLKMSTSKSQVQKMIETYLKISSPVMHMNDADSLEAYIQKICTDIKSEIESSPNTMKGIQISINGKMHNPDTNSPIQPIQSATTSSSGDKYKRSTKSSAVLKREQAVKDKKTKKNKMKKIKDKAKKAAAKAAGEASIESKEGTESGAETESGEEGVAESEL